MVDAGRFARVLLNLVRNAVDAMPQGGILRLSVQQGADAQVVFQVRDTGVGIADDLMARLFEPFVTHGKSKGTGLGLAIAKHVVQRHGGELRIQSQVGKGSTFMLVLPASRIEALTD